ncbi:pyruvate dehydrogenase (acetyl-transferring), homodimeric type [Arcobacter sp. CECT 8989]|uniref:pyruvate dehydrogenase (acetyl-transferring), homodimeric type n=1 Tax=Arcobacter sp. CECT 8989 TaxID=2044509 RepID=UPI00100B5272|nr:pyruvate dehydrogenase (acetyl-transferring), homodimeric type [Arcobacter sp. CECT 8989]RXJ98655.1 pyruvate dehydrogenase (acetyl-transferring), homodimeric type [Arcobacter sp. CECT 8989]
MTNPILNDINQEETQEWLESLEAVIEEEGKERAHFLVEEMIDKMRRNGSHLPYKATTAYINTIDPKDEPVMPGNRVLEEKIDAIVRWNAQAMVVRASKTKLGLGGHISTYASASTLYEVGFNHFFKAANENDGGDLVYFQPHSSPGIYARSFLEGRLSQEQMDNFRQEVGGNGLSSYPHPKLMPTYWQFPTGSMGLGPIQAIYQARFLKYLTNRGIKDCSNQKVYCFLGDGETDEPESLGAIGLAGREGLDNLIFVVNCNLQRLDGPVRGNGKIIQELEGKFRGSDWEVIKVIWSGTWDALINADKSGNLKQIMEDTLDGEYQNFKQKPGEYGRKNFFDKCPEIKDLVKNMSDEEIPKLKRGGQDPVKVYAAFDKATKTKGRPTVILAKTVKGYGMGESGEGKNIAHSVKDLQEEQLKEFRDRFNLPISDEELKDIPYYIPLNDSDEMQYLHKQREELGGYLPNRRTVFSNELNIPKLNSFENILKGTGDREVSTTMLFIRILTSLAKDKNIGKSIVPIVPDEARTFGMEGMFRQIGIYAHEGQKYEPHDRDQVAYYREEKTGQILEEGISEAGAMSSWIAAATSYSVNNCPMIPFYIYYSIFGFQRIGDLAWVAGDIQARGFLIGATSGRTTLNGEGLQHQDGQSHIQSTVIPNCLSYDPTYGYELAVIVQNGIKRMYGKAQENIYYYITVTNENYTHPEIKEGIEEGIIKGIYHFDTVEAKNDFKVKLLGSGAIFEQVRKAARILTDDFDIKSELYSVTSFTNLGREAQEVKRENLLNPSTEPKQDFVQKILGEDKEDIIIATTDYMKSYAEQIRGSIKGEYHTLGTDGFGKSDSRERLREHFEVDAKFIVFSTLSKLAQSGKIESSIVLEAMKKYSISSEKIDAFYA